MRILLNPFAPALLAAVFLFGGALAVYMAGFGSSTHVILLGGLTLLISIPLLITRKMALRIPDLPPETITFIFHASATALAVELAYFGVPLLGQVRYDQFGFPVLHHLAGAYWLLPLFATKRRGFYLLYALFASALLFSRQYALFSIIGYLIGANIPKWRALLITVGVLVIIGVIGVYRSKVVGVELEAGIGLVLGESPLATYASTALYLVGPYLVTFGDQSQLATKMIMDFWNTYPEWFMFTRLWGIPAIVSFVCFYSLTATIAYCMNRSSSWTARVFSVPFHVASFFCFFSSTLIQTPTISQFLIVIGAATLLVPRSPDISTNA